MNRKKEAWIYLVVLLTVAGLAVFFVSVMGYLNYRTSALELEEQVISRIEKDAVADLETSIGFGKSFRNYYGMEEVFASFDNQIDGTWPCVLGDDGTLLYCASTKENEAGSAIEQFLATREFQQIYPELSRNNGGIVKKGRMEMILTAIHQDDEVIGYFGDLYSERIFDDDFQDVRKSISAFSVFIFLLECLLLAVFVRITRTDRWIAGHRRSFDRLLERVVIVLIMGGSILLLSGLSISRYQSDYMEKMEDSVRVSMQNLEDTIRHVQNQGVNLRTVNGLREYIEERVSSLNTLRSILVTEHITEVTRTDEESVLLSYMFDVNRDGARLYLEAELSTEAIQREMKSVVLVLLSTMIILMIFVFELHNLIDLLVAKLQQSEKQRNGISEKQVGIALRFTGFLCSTAEYMCVPYAAMLIRESGESLFGLSVGMTAALPLTMEGLTQMAAMLLLPRFVRKFNVRVTLLLSTVLMIACNMTAFILGGAMTIVLCRAAAGIAYAGFKQVSNYLITKGYETETGRSENISQDNAGLLAGATCGAGLGAILSGNSGYAMTFFFSACLFAAYLLAALSLLPWKALRQRSSEKAGTEKPVRIRDVGRMIFSGEMLFYILVIGIPLNIGVMLCVTLIPAICQTNGISSVMLSYCYIANGIAGIYIGPSLVATAKKYFGIPLSIAFAFALTSLSIFILRVPPVIMMIVITSMILGFLDGFATPMCTDQFMELRVVKNAVDESTALVFSVVLSYVLLTFAPMVAELLLLPDHGIFSPMLVGAAVYAAAAALVFVFRIRKHSA